jgi:hypothetical protein
MNRSPEEQRVVDLEHLRLLRIANFIAAGVAGLIVCLGLLYTTLGTFLGSTPEYMNSVDSEALPPWFFLGFGGLFVVVGAISIVLRLLVAKFLRERRASGFCMFVAAISCIDFPYGTILGVCTIITLTRPSVRDLYSGRDEPHGAVPDTDTGTGL